MKDLENFEQFFSEVKNVFINKEANTGKQLLQNARKFCFQILILRLSKFKRINYLQFPLKSAGNHRFIDF